MIQSILSANKTHLVSYYVHQQPTVYGTLDSASKLQTFMVQN